MQGLKRMLRVAAVAVTLLAAVPAAAQAVTTYPSPDRPGYTRIYDGSKFYDCIAEDAGKWRCYHQGYEFVVYCQTDYYVDYDDSNNNTSTTTCNVVLATGPRTAATDAALAGLSGSLAGGASGALPVYYPPRPAPAHYEPSPGSGSDGNNC